MSSNIQSNNKRIAKNAVMLYIRMFVTMLISLYTSRVILQVLGVTDYGIFNVVAGVIAVMGVVNAALSWATMRYLTFDLGKGNMRSMQNTFSMCLIIFVILSIIFVFISETIGLWFLNNQMTFSPDRMLAANIVYQFAVMVAVLGLVVTPYRSLVFAHEDFDFFAYISIAESVLKLAICFVLMIISFDKLAFYSFMMFSVTAFLAMVQFFWCRIKYEESKFVRYWDMPLFREILSYSGWSLFGSLSSMARNTGLNVILNLFFTPAVNAACGIANQVNGVVYQFFSSFFTAVNPQITKYYAQNNMREMMELVFKSTRFSYYLVLILSIPIALEAPTLMSLWLGQVPEHVVSFTRLMVINTALDAIAFPINASSTATGKIKLYQTVVGVISLLNLPVSYLALWFGGAPECVFVISIGLSIIATIGRLWALNQVISFPFKEYFSNVCLTIASVTTCSVSIPMILHVFWSTGILSSLAIMLISIIITILVAFTIGMNKSERQSIFGPFLLKIRRHGI